MFMFFIFQHGLQLQQAMRIVNCLEFSSFSFARFSCRSSAGQ